MPPTLQDMFALMSVTTDTLRCTFFNVVNIFGFDICFRQGLLHAPVFVFSAAGAVKGFITY